jgi:hypothetical protein
MNIFALSDDVEECAAWHVDRHCVKMLTEYAQLLSTAHRICDGSKDIGLSATGRKQQIWRMDNAISEASLHKATHVNHPSAVWARQSKENYQWLFGLLVALSKEYTFRYGKIYKAFRTDLGDILSQPPTKLSASGLTSVALAMPDEYKLTDHVSSYQNYYKNGKSHLHVWKKRSPPAWILSV